MITHSDIDTVEDGFYVLAARLIRLCDSRKINSPHFHSIVMEAKMILSNIYNMRDRWHTINLDSAGRFTAIINGEIEVIHESPSNR